MQTTCVMESTTESPLDVLSRAATMVQDNIYLPPPYEEARPLNFKCKDVSASSVSGGKWKREKKSRHILAPPPDYATHHAQAKLNSIPEPLPLDMSRKSRGSPPPYTASLASRTTTTNSNTSSNGRASVIISSASSSSSSPPSPGSDQGGSSDPVIDEHFRRSLGADYLNLYKSTSPSPTPCDSALSVDDHFAKALGDTWIKLQEAEHKRCSSRSSDGSDIKPLKRNPTSSSSSTTSTLSPPTSPLTRHPSPGAVPT
ncbi:hypothetical protein M8J76_012877 [Diaphorina citri]|nr:hypothetical protein M8J75_001019 [Diaphorina citri]KAI5750105.1 hypothetical protein M8J76_012877 [Diaphorina citri]